MTTVVEAPAEAQAPAGDPRAAGPCRSQPGLFDSPADAFEELQAKAVCHNQCPLLEQCRLWGTQTRQRYGVWGGTTESERRGPDRDRNAERARVIARGRALAVQHGGRILAERQAGRSTADIATALGAPGPVVEYALQLLTPAGAGTARTAQTALERVLADPDLPRLVKAGASDQEIAAALHAVTGTVADARRILAHRPTPSPNRTAMTPAPGFAEARGDLAQALIPHATGLAVAVREETRPEIRARLAGLSRTELEGLAVVLAAMVDPERPLKEALGWVDFDEYGDPVPDRERSRPRSERTIREAAPRGAVDARVGVDTVAVDRALAGGEVPLNQWERTAAVSRGLLKGLGYDLVAERLGMERDAVQRSWERYKQREREAGRAVPDVPVNEIRAMVA